MVSIGTHQAVTVFGIAGAALVAMHAPARRTTRKRKANRRKPVTVRAEAPQLAVA
jgi:hypothetical protein